MDKLTELKRLKLINESLKCELNMQNNHKDIKKMYALISDMAIASENSDDIKALITTKIALDFLVKAVLNDLFDCCMELRHDCNRKRK